MFLLEKHDVSAFLFFPSEKKQMFVWLVGFMVRKEGSTCNQFYLHKQKS
jgi:hypothetical protein